MRIGYNEIMITSKYFNDINDFINLEIGVKRFQGNMERFHFNPIPLDEYSRKLFPNIETFHIYKYNDKIFNDGKIFKKVIWYLVDYSTYLKEKEQGNIFKNIEYTKEDRHKHGTTIPPEVKFLGYECFYNCYELASINIPTTIKEIGYRCFWNCESLKSVTIPSSVSEIGGECFCYCDSLTSIDIENIKYVSEEKIFMNEPVLDSIEIPYNLEIINGENIKKSDVNEFIIPSTITKLGCSCFNNCCGLKSINISSTITQLGGDCFKDCYNLTSINIPTSISRLGWYCFKGCYSLMSINIPSSISEIGYDCFKDCFGLTSITIPSSVIQIGYGCFSGCCSLISINIPTSVTSFGYKCFYNCGCVKELKKNKNIPEDSFKW
ncbi:hypothetical protein, conserved [Entamoeba dispar SAW760]|uniref:Leucine rich repeat containing protein BspA family protein n=1 Tax=Entamoeba dispar (strain ATCC PRA-260 / SAW760) TaxID=370354 RepID=B0EEE3_ENTDS|nr:uncharacterized protein EDI_108670 [Entamoeba dispar SAW760]EDR27107.1 hypothetical protein, conserved [Entamoeba dispar SAW760]|eukprot:EDR27107.1 hypothetical protein, conserved [Entamoeba dispar SAW760]